MYLAFAAEDMIRNSSHRYFTSKFSKQEYSLYWIYRINRMIGHLHISYVYLKFKFNE